MGPGAASVSVNSWRVFDCVGKVPSERCDHTSEHFFGEEMGFYGDLMVACKIFLICFDISRNRM